MTIAALAAALALTPLAAQDADTQAAPATGEAIGPRELQGFSLPGTVTREAEAPAAPAPRAATPPAPRPAEPDRSEASEARPAQRTVDRTPADAAAPDRASPVRASPDTTSDLAPPASGSSVTVALPPARAASDGAAASSPDFSDDAEGAGFSPGPGLPLWPWLLAALALGLGGGFLYWRRSHGREAFAGGPGSSAFLAPEPIPPAPRAPPIAPPAAAPAAGPRPAKAPPSGLVSTRLRPWIEIDFLPLRCVVEDKQVTFDFELILSNSGQAPAQDVLIEAAMVNASPTQDKDIAAFIGRQVGPARRIPLIEPMKRMPLRPSLTLPIESLRLLDAGGRRVFVPLIVLHAMYRWNGREGQSSAVYLVGRETAADKLAPFRVDLGARIFRGLGARKLDGGLRE